MKKIVLTILAISIFGACKTPSKEPIKNTESEMEKKVAEYAKVTLKTDLSKLTEKERQLVSVFIDIAEIMDDLYWEQTFPNRAVLDTITDSATKEFALINYGVWDRLDDLKPFVSGYDKKALGANFYPSNMTNEEFEAYKDPNKTSLYTLIRRGADGKLQTIWYKDAYKNQLSKAIELMKKAKDIAEDEGLKKYLDLRIKAFETDDYFESDMAWMDMKTSNLDFVVGPIENYEDRLFGYKAAYESFVLVKDTKWSNDLAKFTKMLPELQKELPCDPKYKQEVPGTDSDLNVYDVLYYAGDCNSGSKTIAINLPNDERVHLEKGTRRLQLKNAMKAKFDQILLPIAEISIDKQQLKNVKFEAFFSNVTFHEVAHGLGIKNTITDKKSIRQVLKEEYSVWEEAKADILGVFMVQKLIERGEITDCTVEETYTTFIAGMLRSVRFGAASAHGKANAMCYNFFETHEAFTRNAEGRYVIDLKKAQIAMAEWAALVLKMEGEGNYELAKKYNSENSIIKEALQKDLDKIKNANIAKDIRFEQGKKILGL